MTCDYMTKALWLAFASLADFLSFIGLTESVGWGRKIYLLGFCHIINDLDKTEKVGSMALEILSIYQILMLSKFFLANLQNPVNFSRFLPIIGATGREGET